MVGGTGICPTTGRTIRCMGDPRNNKSYYKYINAVYLYGTSRTILKRVYYNIITYTEQSTNQPTNNTQTHTTSPRPPSPHAKPTSNGTSQYHTKQGEIPRQLSETPDRQDRQTGHVCGKEEAQQQTPTANESIVMNNGPNSPPNPVFSGLTVRILVLKDGETSIAIVKAVLALWQGG